MPGKPVKLAKLTRPKLFGAHRRDRLFARLDELRDHPVVWIAGPPGAGKTTLVASYLEERDVRGIWYQVDATDTDIATFAYYLGIAAEPFASKKTPPLPLFIPEFAADLEGFLRRYFRNLCARLPVGAVMVFDNFQESRADSLTRAAFARGLEDVPEGINVILLSRGMPPPEFSRLAANEKLARLDWEELRFSAEESRSVATACHALEAGVVETLHTLSGGWPAGLVLMSEHVQAAVGGRGPDVNESYDAVFDYFAGEIFSRAPPERQHLLMVTSLLPRFTVAMAKQLSGNPGALKILDGLYRRHLFLNRRGGTDGTYEYHALFRAFLRSRARVILSTQEFRRLAAVAAGLLKANGMAADAFELYVGGGDWEAAAETVTELAPHMLAQGRGQNLRDLIARLPAELREPAPWLRYWSGMALAAINPGQARDDLEKAYHQFAATQDVVGQVLCAAAMVDVYYVEWNDFRPLDMWIARLNQLIALHPAFPTPDIEAAALSSMLIALTYRQPGHGSLQATAACLMALLDEELEVNRAVRVGTCLVNYNEWFGKHADTERVAARVLPLLDLAGVTALNRAWWHTWHALHFFLAAELSRSAEVLEQAVRTLRENGLRFAEPMVLMCQACVALSRGDTATAGTKLAESAPLLDHVRSRDLWLNHLTRSWHALLLGETELALKHGHLAVGESAERGAPMIHIFSLCALAHAAIEGGDEAFAERSIDLVLTETGGPSRQAWWFRFHAQLVDAELARRRGDRTHCHEQLRAAFELGRVQGFFNTLYSSRRVLTSLVTEALRFGIETEYARRLISRLELSPLSADVEVWPWPVKIYTLGRFGVVIDDLPLNFTGKAQKRPLDLLKALISQGGRDVDFTALMAILWPGATGDAQKSFEMALSRLRKLLGQSEVIQMRDGKLALNPQVVWVDAWAFERLLPRADGEMTSREDVDVQTEDRAQRAFELYQGRFLGRDPKAPWMQVMADRLQAKFLRLVLTLGRKHETTNWDQAAQVYARGLELDSLAEELYRRLMICHRERGQLAEAMNVYRRCRENLSIILGVAPSADTVALYDSLRQQ